MQSWEIERKTAARVDGLAKRENSPLTSVLAEMLHCALTWEVEQGGPPQNVASYLGNGLTAIGRANTLLLKTDSGGENAENDDHD